VAAANGDASVRGNVHRHDVQVEGIGVTRKLDREFAGNRTSGVIDGHDEAQERDHADEEKNLAACNASRADVFGASRDGAIVELDQPEEDKRERPPMEEHITQLQAAVIVEEE
jgi:hypothetical protein